MTSSAHFADFPQFQGDTSYNQGITRFAAILKRYPKVTFIGHADGFWANVRAEVEPTAYPSGRIKPGGISDKLLADYPNLHVACRRIPAGMRWRAIRSSSRDSWSGIRTS